VTSDEWWVMGCEGWGMGPGSKFSVSTFIFPLSSFKQL
jgi:hypothetical protein